MQRLVEQLLLLTRADEGAVTQAPRDVDLDDLALAVARRVRRPGLARRHLRNRARAGPRGPGRRSPRWCRTSSTTPPGTPTPSWPSPSSETERRRRARRRGRRPRDPRGAPAAGLRPVRAARRGPRPGRRRERSRAGDRPGDRHRPRRDRRRLVVGSGRRPVRRTPSAGRPTRPRPERAFQTRSGGLQRRSLHAGANQSGTPRSRKGHPMNITKLRRKRVILPTIAAVAVLGVGGTVWTASANDDVQGRRARPRRRRGRRGRRRRHGSRRRDQRRPRRGLRGRGPHGRRHRGRRHPGPGPERGQPGRRRPRRQRRQRRPRATTAPDADDRALSAEERQSAEQAALDAVGGGTVEQVEASDDRGEAYEVEVRTDDGTEWDVTLDADFQVLNKTAND